MINKHGGWSSNTSDMTSGSAWCEYNLDIDYYAWCIFMVFLVPPDKCWSSVKSAAFFHHLSDLLTYHPFIWSSVVWRIDSIILRTMQICSFIFSRSWMSVGFERLYQSFFIDNGFESSETFLFKLKKILHIHETELM